MRRGGSTAGAEGGTLARMCPEPPISLAHAIDAVTHADPYPWYAARRAEASLAFDEVLGLWVVVRADAVRAALRSPALRVRPPAEPVPRALVGTATGEAFGHLVRMNDGAFHATHRPDVDRAAERFGAEDVAAATRTAVDALRGETDVNVFLSDLSVHVTATLLGVPPAERAVTARRVQAFAHGIAAGASEEALAHAEEATVALLADGARAGLDPVRAANRIALMQQPVDATAGLLGNAVLVLRGRPDAAERLRQESDARAFVAEVARWDSPVQNTRRFAAEDLTLSGAAIRAGDALLLVLASANRDDAMNPDAEAFDADRVERKSLTFGDGAHGCPGEAIAIGIVATALAALRLDDPRFERFVPTGRYRPLPNARVPVFAALAG